LRPHFQKKSGRENRGRIFLSNRVEWNGYMVREHFPLQPHPGGGAENPPEPLGIPFGRTHPADISFCTWALLHSGHAGSGSQQDLAIDSN
jgi:hypothetical protein